MTPYDRNLLGMTVDEVAQRLGKHRNTILSYIYQKRLRAVKLGKAWYVKEEDLKRFIDSGANMEVPAA